VEVPIAEKSYSNFVPWLRAQSGPLKLGIAPLLDTEFNRYKSDLKVLDYGAMGLPVLASDVESFRSFASAPVDGVILVPNNPEAWANEIIRAFAEDGKLEASGDALQRWVFEHRRTEDQLSHYDALISEYLLGIDA
jgi:glycosyltransferase involved in cell wall biosynthesis